MRAVQVEGELIFLEGILVKAAGGQASTLADVSLRGPALGALQGKPRIEGLGLFPERLRILKGGAIPVAEPLGFLAGPECRGRDAAQGQRDYRAQA